MSPTEAKQTDPMQRLQLLTAYEALEMAGYSYDRTSATNHKRIATFFGQSCDDYRQTNAAQEINTFYIPGGARAFGPGRVSYHFGWEGPSYSIDTACSASIASIHLASQALHSQECDTAVVSAANILTTPDNFAGLTRGGFVSTTAACKTLDQTADGYCRADAVCTLVLKRLSNAIADNDNVHAVIKATGLNSAAQAISITHPHAGSQADLFTKTLRQADLVPDDIIHFELHGTGTQGSQKPGMAKELFAASQIFRESIESSAKICHDIGYKKLLDYLILPNEAILDDNIGAQLALVAFELALATMWQSLGLVPQAVIGHSLGEYSALCVAGTLSVTVTLYLVYHRARLLHEHCSSGTHAMLSTLASPQEVGQYRKKFGTSAELCCANGPRSTVVGGFKNDIDHLSIELLSNDIKTSIIELPFAFHTRSVEKILPEFGVHCEQIRLKRPKVPFGSSLLGTFIEDNEELPPNYLSRQTREPVLFAKALIQGFEADIVGKDMTWIEIGPSTTCLTFIKTTLSIDERYLLPSSSSSHSQDSVARSLAQAYRNGLDLSWSEYHRQHERCLNLLELPSYAFDLENYWIQYRGNWSLLKDRRRPEQSSEMYLGPTLHKLVKERNEGGSRTFEFETDTENEDFRQI